MTEEQAETFDALCDDVSQARFRLEIAPTGNGQYSKCHHRKELHKARLDLFQFIKNEGLS